MTIGINAYRWKFLSRDKVRAYIQVYERLREEGWKKLVPSTTRRQFATASEILTRMNNGQQGVLLADDVGLGKTTVAALCALVFAGSEKRVRILAPNEMMSRRWRQELEVHIKAVGDFAPHLNLERTRQRLGIDVRKLTPNTIAVSTHHKAKQLACDLLIIDEAHRTRSENSNLAKRINQHRKAIGRVLVLIATPFSIDPNDLARLLARIGGRTAEKPMRNYARMLDDLWHGRSSGAPEDLARQLVEAARNAVEAMRPFVIRHGIDDLRAEERRAFGEVDDRNGAEATFVSDELLEAMLRTDRALALGRECKAWRMKRLNDPRYHVAAGKLENDLTALLVAIRSQTADDAAALARHHAQIARQHIRSNGRHPKIADTVKTANEFVEQGEKVLIFCDHHLPAVELTCALAEEIRWPSAGMKLPPKKEWRSAWELLLSNVRPKEERKDGREQSLSRFEHHYLDWLVSEGVRMQVASWLGTDLLPTMSATDLKRLLEKARARAHSACDTIAVHALQLYQQLVDRESGSTRAILLRDDELRLPGTTKARIAAVCQPETDAPLRKHPGSSIRDSLTRLWRSSTAPSVPMSSSRQTGSAKASTCTASAGTSFIMNSIQVQSGRFSETGGCAG